MPTRQVPEAAILANAITAPHPRGGEGTGIDGRAALDPGPRAGGVVGSRVGRPAPFR
jgi:hypothetical protein